VEPQKLHASPYAVFSPARVTRRLLELFSLAAAIKAEDTNDAKAGLELRFLKVSIHGLRQGQLIDLGAGAAAIAAMAATSGGVARQVLGEVDEEAGRGQLLVNVAVDVLPGSGAVEGLARFPLNTWRLCLTAALPDALSFTATAEAPGGHLEVGHCARVAGEGAVPLAPLPVGNLLQRAVRAGSSAKVPRGSRLAAVRITARVLAGDVTGAAAGGSDVELGYASIVVLAPLPR
jgi:hypothetical protein